MPQRSGAALLTLTLLTMTLFGCPGAPNKPITGPSGPPVAPYGSWRSPISADLVAANRRSFSSPLVISPDGAAIFWVENRTAEAGRAVLVRWTEQGGVEDLTPPPFSVRSRVHEYGGGAFAVDGDSVVFSNADDGRLYLLELGGGAASGSKPRALTPAGKLRYADMVFDRRRKRVIAVREDHRLKGHEALNTLVAVELTPHSGSAEGLVLVSGADFYSTPRLSPDGRELAWLAWSHPSMPWDGTELWRAALDGHGQLMGGRRVAGGKTESIFQPEWSPGGTLHFVSDRTGWWNLYRQRGNQLEPITKLEAELGVPQWVFGLSTYAFLEGGEIACAINQDGSWRLALIEPDAGKLTRVPVASTSIWNVRAAGRRIVFEGASQTRVNSVVRLDLGPGAAPRERILRRSLKLDLSPGYLSKPEALTFKSSGGRAVHAFFYAPVNRDYRGPQGQRPPLLVISHGGPTGQSRPVLSAKVQYWTSRGFAVLDVNYGGSTGYGRPYRDALKGQWGVVDVDDCVAGARHVVRAGRVDGQRLAIRGWSAGGYTTLSALAFRDLFHAGASYYGVSDLEPFAKETHKFESRYLERLVAPYPQQRAVYRARAPLHHVEGVKVPVIFFQGLADPVVPPAQAEAMVKALRARGAPVAYLPFAGEKHGFRKADNIKRALEAELYFYGKVLGFEPADKLAPIPISNCCSKRR
jgi:dipeptidyl aminopeptidase/acylaminoacyl peptidase